MGDHYLTVHMWDKSFNPYRHEILSTMVWARLLDLPAHYFHPEAVMKIGKRIGKPIRVDHATSTGARLDYARICVQVDLTKPLLSQFRIHGIKYFIQYEIGEADPNSSNNFPKSQLSGGIYKNSQVILISMTKHSHSPLSCCLFLRKFLKKLLCPFDLVTLFISAGGELWLRRRVMAARSSEWWRLDIFLC
ncbi:unnamed protein product [Linum tenue]|nr:unnamed protein product [Linum tenue]